MFFPSAASGGREGGIYSAGMGGSGLWIYLAGTPTLFTLTFKYGKKRGPRRYNIAGRPYIGHVVEEHLRVLPKIGFRAILLKGIR